MSKNTLLWQMSTVCLVEVAVYRFLNETIKDMPLLKDGSRGYMWGLERKYGDNSFDLGINGYADKGANELRVVDYYITEQRTQELCKSISGDVILKVAKEDTGGFNQYEEDELPKLIQQGYVRQKGGILSLNLPVYSHDQFSKLKKVLEPIIDKMELECRRLVPITESILKNYVPTFLRDQLSAIASLKQVENFISNSMNTLYLNKFIDLPKPCNELLSSFVVLSRN